MRTAIARLSLLSILLGGCSIASTSAPPELVAEAANTDVNIQTQYETYRQVLQMYVDDKGLVDYEALQANRQPLDEFLAAIARVSDDTYNSWSEDQQIAFWINAYNAYTLASIIDQQPLKASIKDITGVWRFNQHPVQGQSLTLDHIEHQILRANFNEPRIHAALVCAAVSCPPLRAEPFVGESLDTQLDDQVEQFLAKSDGLDINTADGVVYLSKIFEWFGEDWTATYSPAEGFTGSPSQRSVLNFVANYVDAEDSAYLQAGNYDVQYLDYDWSLNSQE